MAKEVVTGWVIEKVDRRDRRGWRTDSSWTWRDGKDAALSRARELEGDGWEVRVVAELGPEPAKDVLL